MRFFAANLRNAEAPALHYTDNRSDGAIARFRFLGESPCASDCRGRDRRRRRAHRPPSPRFATRSGGRAVRSGIAALGRQRPVRIHGRRHRPADLSRSVCRDDPARHALPLGLALVAQPGRLVDRKVPLPRIRRPRPQGRLRRYSRATDARRKSPGCGPIHIDSTSAKSASGSPSRTAQPAKPNDLTEIRQTLRLWDGVLVSHFQLEGQSRSKWKPSAIRRSTCVAVRVTSPLVAKGQIAIELKFPYGTGEVKTADWDHPDAHETTFAQPSATTARFGRSSTTINTKSPPAGPTAASSSEPRDTNSSSLPRTARIRWTSQCWFSHEARRASPPISTPPPRSPANTGTSSGRTGGAIDLSA